MIDLVAELQRLKNKDNNITFSQSTDSLEAISEAIRDLVLDIQGLAYYGVVTAVPGANQFTVPQLAGYGETCFVGWTAFVFWDAGGAGAAPQGESKTITTYVDATGTFTTAAFTAAVAAGDSIIVIHPSIASVLSSLLVPAADAITNVVERDVIGNKTDTANYTVDGLSSIMRYLKALMNAQIIAYGTLTTSSLTVPADAGRTASYPHENNNYFNGCQLVPLSGNARFQARYIADYTSATGVFTLDGSNPFTNLPGLVNYVIITGSNSQVSAIDTFSNNTINDAIGNKADTDAFDPSSSHSLFRLLKAIMKSLIMGYGTLTTSSATVPADNTRIEADGFFNGSMILIRAGAIERQIRRVVRFTQPGGIFVLDPCCPLTAAPGAVSYAILKGDFKGIATADGTSNYTADCVIGNKTSTPIYTPDNVSDLMRYMKGIMNLMAQVSRPTNGFLETWQDETGLFAPVWSDTNPATGTAWTKGVSGAWTRVYCAPNASENGRLRTVERIAIDQAGWNTNRINRRLVIETELQLGSVANIDNTAFFIGFMTGTADTRASNNIIGWALTGDALQSVTDNAGTETVNTGFGETLTNINKLRIEVYSGNAKFYVNEVLKATHVTNIPSNVFYWNNYIVTEAGGAANISSGETRYWFEDFVR